jgi:hypothetical protein
MLRLDRLDGRERLEALADRRTVDPEEGPGRVAVLPAPGGPPGGGGPSLAITPGELVGEGRTEGEQPFREAGQQAISQSGLFHTAI